MKPSPKREKKMQIYSTPVGVQITENIMWVSFPSQVTIIKLITGNTIWEVSLPTPRKKK